MTTSGRATVRLGDSGDDVEEAQTLLKQAGAPLHGEPDARFGPDTYQAVRQFQATHALHVDGVVGPRTWQALTGAVYAWSGKTAEGSGAVTPAPVATTPTAVAAGDFCFPLAERPVDWRGGFRFFGAHRPRGRKHAGCDLYAPLGTQIYAIADGVVVRGPYEFVRGQNVDAIEVHHGGLLVRYGEIQPGSCGYTTGQRVRQGQPFARVGKLTSLHQAMLHLEVYTHGGDSSSLTDRHRPPYQRRSDVADPAPYLDQWVRNMPR